MTRRSDAAAALAALADEVRTHRGCGFEPCETCTQLVPGEGAAAGDVLLVGEAPGAQEDRLGRPFVGSAGRLLDELLGSVGLARDAVYITNVVKARPPGNRDPRPDELAHHRPWLDRELELVRPRLVVTLGRHALGAFVPGGKISQVHGRSVEVGGRLLLPLYHPAAALRARPLRLTLTDDVGRIPELLA